MIKKVPEGESLRRRIEESVKDRLYHFLLDYGSVRGALLHGTRLVGEMRANHELGPLETLVLGHAYVGAALMSVNLKGTDRLKLQVQCSGPVRGLAVEANAFGEVRGYLAEVPIPAEAPVDPADLTPLFREGVLTVTRYLADAKQPFSGQVALERRSLAENLTHYFLASEQAGSVIHLSVRFDARGEVLGAGGLFLQVLPGAEESAVDRLEELVNALPSVGAAFAEGLPAEELLAEWFAPMNPLLLGNRRVAFMCHCSAQRFGRFMGALPRDELADMLEKGPFPVVTTCFNCNSQYDFSRGEIERLYQEHP
jgi:molecular chaperone Hsp33